MALLTLLIGFGLGCAAMHIAVARADARVKGLIEDVCREDFELDGEAADAVVDGILADIDPHAEAVAERDWQIDLGKIIAIESGGDPRAMGSAGEIGLCQIRRATWAECTQQMGVAWSFPDDAFDPGCNRAVAHHYLNKRIPAMLDHYGIDDNVATRIGCYNWGIGHVREAWRRYDDGWLSHAPQVTRDYVVKYATLTPHE